MIQRHTPDSRKPPSTAQYRSLGPADLARLALLQVNGRGPVAARRSFAENNNQRINDPIEFLLSFGITLDDSRAALESAWRITEDCKEAGVAVLSLNDTEYPAPLRAIPDPPPFLYVKGCFPESWALSFAVIGTRHPTSYAQELTRRLVSRLSSDAAAVVVSGLATGIDAEAHQSAIRCGLTTVAVLAHGLDMVYPAANRALAQDIIDTGGALISEFPIGIKPARHSFVARDRIQSGLSIATFLMQSSLAGGSMHTAYFTLQQDRVLIALKPPDPGDEWLGNLFLLTAGSNAWEGSTELQRFVRFISKGRPLAFCLSDSNLEEFVKRGLPVAFRPRQGLETNPDESPVPLPF